MANTIKVEIVTPARKFYQGEAELVIARTLNGDEGFMAGHVWGVKLLDIGELWIREAGAEPNTFKLAAIAGGFIDVKDSIIIYTDAAEWSKEIDLDKNAAEKARAEEWLKANEGKAPDYEVERAKVAIRKAEVREEVAGGGRMAAKH